MLLVIDVGNTNTVLGVFAGSSLTASWRIMTKDRTTDELGLTLAQLLERGGYSLKEITGVIVSCVVPPLYYTFEHFAKRYLNINPIMVGPGVRTGMPILYENPREVGADRIVNAVAAYEQYHCALIAVDFGTATTFDCISPKGEYMGGVICPGIGISLEALYRAASKLPRVEIDEPKSVIGRTTIGSMQSGIYYGYVSLVDGMVTRILGEMPEGKAKVIATGGLGRLLSQESKTIEAVHPDLTLYGLRIIYERNQNA